MATEIEIPLIIHFVSALLAHGATGLLQFQDGLPALTGAQWTQLDLALGG